MLAPKVLNLAQSFNEAVPNVANSIEHNIFTPMHLYVEQD